MHNNLSFLFLFTGLCGLSIACGGGGATCEQAFDKAIECSENPAKSREEAKSLRKDAIAECNENKSEAHIKAGLACAKKSSCDDFRACDLELRFGDDIKEVKERVAAGELEEAMSDCTLGIEAYRAAPAFKEVCDKVTADVFTKLGDKKMFDEASFRCSEYDDAKEWLAASSELRAGCTALAADYLVQLTEARGNESYDHDGKYHCGVYKKMVLNLTPDKGAAAEMLCDELYSIDDFKEITEEVTQDLDDKIEVIPYLCTNHFDFKKPINGSTWHAAKTKKLATLCYGSIGKIILADISGSYCSKHGEQVHKYAAKYLLGEDDPELAKLLSKTAAACTKQ